MMSSFLPDCGILSSPTAARPNVSTGPLTPVDTNVPFAKLGAGMSVSFYHSPKTASSVKESPASRPSPLSRRHLHRWKAVSINKGVGHSIKKPKLKAKEKASNPAKESVRRLKRVKPPPRLAPHRSAAALTPTGKATKKRHMLSSPGMSLLDGTGDDETFMPVEDESNSGSGSSSSKSRGKFFTSRAGAAATVQITKNVQLSAIYGNISLSQRSSGGWLRKNIGREASTRSDKVGQTTTVATAAKKPFDLPLPSLSSLSVRDRPKLTRFPGTPSPVKRKVIGSTTVNGVRSSPRRHKPGQVLAGSSDVLASPKRSSQTKSLLNNATSNSASRTLNMNALDSSHGKSSSSPSKTGDKTSVTDARSPSKFKGTPNKVVTPNKAQMTLNNVQKSPVIQGSSPYRGRGTPNKKTPNKDKSMNNTENGDSLMRSLDKVTNSKSPTRSPKITPTKTRNLDLSPRKLLLTKLTPSKVITIIRQSPRKSIQCPTSKAMLGTAVITSVQNQDSRNVVIEMVHKSPVSTPEKRTVNTMLNSSPSRAVRSSPRSSRFSPYKTTSGDTNDGRVNGGSPLRNRNSSVKYCTPLKIASKATPTKSLITTPTRRSRSSGTNGTSGSPLQKKLDDEDSDARAKLFPVFDSEKRLSDGAKMDDGSKTTSKSCGRGLLAAVGDPLQQMLDAGQKRFGVEQCKECGLMYEVADPDDEVIHRRFHNRVTTALAYTGWKKENQVTQMDVHGGRCIMVTSSAPPYCWRKVKNVLEVIDEELGFSEPGVAVQERTSAYMYIRDNQICACLIAEKTNNAYRVIPEADSQGSFVLSCSKEKQSVMYGISRVWVKKTCRRMGLATVLVNAFRAQTVSYHYLTLDQFAFSNPTPSGIEFAQAYTKRKDFLVY